MPWHYVCEQRLLLLLLLQQSGWDRSTLACRVVAMNQAVVYWGIIILKQL